MSCGGGGSSSPQPKQNPAPVIGTISPSSAPAGSRAVTLSVSGLNFIQGSIVQWNGASRDTAFVSSSRLTASIAPSDLSTAGTALVAVFTPAPGGGTSSTSSFAITSVDPVSILTTRLPDAQHDKAYSYAVQATGGVQPYTFSITAGSLPSGLSISSSGGAISGTPPTVASDTNSPFTVQVSDYSYQARTAAQPLSIRVRASSLGRNDTCSTATSVSNGILRASISPFGDIDVYSFHGTAGQRVTLEIYAQRLDLDGDSTNIDVYLDSFLELLNSNCTRIAYNDDIDPGVNLDSAITSYLLPSTGTYYIRVSDLRGDGRPDFIYELHVSGADQ